MSESLNEAFEVRRKSVELEERFVQVALFLDKPPNIEAFRAAFGFAGTEISDDDRYGLRMVNQLLLRMGHLRTAYETAEASRDALDIEAMEREYARVKDINESIHSEFERRGFVQTSQSVEENQRDTARDDVLLSEMSVENPTTTDKGVPVKIRSLEELGVAMQAGTKPEVSVPDTDPVTFEKVSLEEWFLAVHTIFNQSDSESLGVSASAESFREAILRVAPLQSDFEHLMQEKVAALQAELERLRAEDVTSTDVKIQEGYISGARHLVKNKALLEALYGAFESEPQVPAEPTDVSIASEVSPAAEPIETNDDSNIQLSERLVSWPRKTGVPNPEYRKLAKEHVEGYTPEELETLKELYRRGDIRAVLPDGKIKPLALICAEYEKIIGSIDINARLFVKVVKPAMEAIQNFHKENPKPSREATDVFYGSEYNQIIAGISEALVNLEREPELLQKGLYDLETHSIRDEAVASGVYTEEEIANKLTEIRRGLLRKFGPNATSDAVATDVERILGNVRIEIAHRQNGDTAIQPVEMTPPASDDEIGLIDIPDEPSDHSVTAPATPEAVVEEGVLDLGIPEDVPVLERVKISRADDVIDVEDISPIDAEKSPEAAAIKEARRLTRETKKELTELGAILQSPEFKAKKNALNKKVKIPGDISDIGRKEIETRNESNRAEVDGAEARYAALQNLYIQQLEDGLSKLQAIKPSDLEEQSKDKTYDAVKAEWYYRHIESNWLSELYTQKLKQSYTSHYKVRGAEGAVARTWTSTKNFFGFKPELNEIGEGLEALHEREQVAQARQYEFAEKLMDAKKVTTSKDLTVSEVPKLIDEYRATLDRTLVVNRMRERHNIQKEAFANITDRESTVKSIMLVLQKNKWKMRAAKVVAYGVIGGATGGIGAAVLGAGSAGLRTAAGVVGGVAGGRFGRGVGAVGVERAQVKLKEIETKKLESLTAEMLSERRAKLISALTEEDAAKRDQKIYQVIGAVAGGGLAAAYAPDVSQYVQAKFSAPPDIQEGVTTPPLPPENPVAMEPLPELPNSSFSVPESITPETLPPLSDVAEVPVPQADTPDLAALRAMAEQGVTKGDLEAAFAAAPIPEPVEVVPEVTTVLPADEGHILTLEEVMNRPLIPQPDAALVPEVPHTPLDYTSAERLTEQEHLFRLGDQFGKGTVSEQIYEAWKNGDLEHLQWVPSPDEMSHQEFLAAMNQYIDPNSPDFMSPEEIRSMDIESGDFTKMPYGDEYDALPLLDKMFPSHAPIALETMLPPENEFVGEAFVLPGASTAEFPSGSIAFQADEIRPSSEEVVGVPYATQSTETGVSGEVVVEGRPLARVAVTRPAVVGGVTSSPEIPSAVSPDPETEVAADIPARGGDTFANAPAESMVSLETFQKLGFHTQVVEYVRSEVQDLPGVSADKVMQEIENRSTELFGAEETVDVAAIKDFVHGVTHREYVLNALTPVTADDATNVLFNKVFSEMTFAEMTNDIESTNSITKDLFVKYELAQGAESAHSLSELITYTLTTFGHDTSLTIAGRMEELFQNGDLTFSTDHGSILDKHGAVVFTFAS